MQCKLSSAWNASSSPTYIATVSGRGIVHLPAELRRRFHISPGDKVELRPGKEGILLERIGTLEEGFGRYPGLGRRWAIELLQEKKAELAREERNLAKEEARIRRLARGSKIRV